VVGGWCPLLYSNLWLLLKLCWGPQWRRHLTYLYYSLINNVEFTYLPDALQCELIECKKRVGALQFLVSIVQPAWIMFLSHEKMCENDSLLKCILPLLQAVSKSLIKVSPICIIDSLFVFCFCAVVLIPKLQKINTGNFLPGCHIGCPIVHYILSICFFISLFIRLLVSLLMCLSICSSVCS